MKYGDFTLLADEYSENRPDYSQSALMALTGLLEKPISEIDFVDVGAGTGIWTRMVCEMKPKSVTAIEPNDNMRTNGIKDSENLPIVWKSGAAEKTGLPSECCDWVTMASSFHWAIFDEAVAEFHRILRNGGRFTALWNPRLIEVNPILVEIEGYLNELLPDMKRVSSGRSGITETLTEKILASGYFEDVIYVEGRHVIEMSPQRYMGIWRSVNDLRVQLGEEGFQKFLSFVEKRISGLDTIETTYLTRAWSAKRHATLK